MENLFFVDRSRPRPAHMRRRPPTNGLASYRQECGRIGRPFVGIARERADRWTLGWDGSTVQPWFKINDCDEFRTLMRQAFGEVIPSRAARITTGVKGTVENLSESEARELAERVYYLLYNFIL